MTDEMEYQMNLFDLDSWCGRTSQEACPVTKEKTSKPSSRKLRGSQNQTLPMCLCLKSGASQGASTMTWVDGQLLGEYTQRSFGVYPKDGIESQLSEILVEDALPKYYLSGKAAAGILRRSEKRGKPLPEILRKALVAQAE